MKTFSTLIFLLLVVSAAAQKPIRLKSVTNQDTLSSNATMICGSFIQRLSAMTSGGLLQELYIIDSASNQSYFFRPKPLFKGSKENDFLFSIPPGTYHIQYYRYQKGVWYGIKEFIEPIRRTDGQQYQFTVEQGKLNSLGTWCFDKPEVSFASLNEEMKAKLIKEHPQLDFSKAVLYCPH